MDYSEGATPLTADELVGLKQKHVTTRSELDHLEQANIQNGIEWLKRMRKKDLLADGGNYAPLFEFAGIKSNETTP